MSVFVNSLVIIYIIMLLSEFFARLFPALSPAARLFCAQKSGLSTAIRYSALFFPAALFGVPDDFDHDRVEFAAFF